MHENRLDYTLPRRRTTVHGKVTIAQPSDSAPPTAIPTSRNGSRINQTRGYSTSAAMARGQHSTNRMHHSRKVSIPVSFENTMSVLQKFGRVSRQLVNRQAPNTAPRHFATHRQFVPAA